jgi:hypothetical protein
MIAQGKYRARAVGGDFGKTPNTGTDFVKVTFVIADGPHKSEHVAWNGWFGPNSTERTIESLKSCGCTFPGNDITNLAGIDSKDVEIVVEHEAFEGRDGKAATAVKVSWVNALAGGINPEAKMDAGAKASFAQKMKGALLMMNKGAPLNNGSPSTATTGAAPSAGAAGDDIPF